MARPPKEIPFRWAAILCVFGLLWLAGDVIANWGGDEGLAGVGPASWASGILCAIGLPFLVMEYRQLRLAKLGQQAVPPTEDEPAP
jgi:hypothetical protein